MPNQRAKNKVHFGGYILKDLRRQIARKAAKEGWTGSHFGYVIHLVEPLVDAKYKKLQARKKSSRRPQKKTPR